MTNTGCQISDKASIDTKKEIAKMAGVSHDTIAKVKKIEAAATPEVKEKLRKNEITINQAYNKIKNEERKAEIRRQVEKAFTAEFNALCAFICYPFTPMSAHYELIEPEKT